MFRDSQQLAPCQEEIRSTLDYKLNNASNLPYSRDRLRASIGSNLAQPQPRLEADVRQNYTPSASVVDAIILMVRKYRSALTALTSSGYESHREPAE
jgi:hypothetical protein